MKRFDNIVSEATVDTNSKDYKQGYEDAIRAFKEMMEQAKNGNMPNSGGSGSGSGGSGSGGDSGQQGPMPKKLADDAKKEAMKNGAKQSQGQKPGQGQSGQGQSGQSRDDETAPGKNQGVVRPEDCGGGSGLKDTPSQAGGVIDKKDGDNMAQQEGYEKQGGSEAGVESDWEKDAMKAADSIQKKAGSSPAYEKWASRIKSMNRPTTDWKKTLRKVVGRCLSDEDKRQAYANKNTLVAQSRIARTDKDKYDALSTIVVFIDTSGSMDNSYKQECLEEIYHVANQKKATKILIIPFDTEPKDFIVINNIQKLKQDIQRGLVYLKGGGGTDLKKCWDLFKTDKRFKGQCFELVMIFTDGALQQLKRLPRSMQHLVWVIDKDPSWEIQYKDSATYRVDLGDKNAHKKV